MPLDAMTAARQIDLAYGSPLDVISWSLRGMIKAAPGQTLYCADYAAIESRGQAWLADEKPKLEMFRQYDAGTGPEPYRVTAGGILGKAPELVTDDERQTFGKVPDLACGYQGAVGAFQQMAKTYLVKVSDDIALAAVQGWRRRHPKIESYWYELDRAAKDAVFQRNAFYVDKATGKRRKGIPFVVGPEGREVKFRVAGSFLWCQLPSKRNLCYPYPWIDKCYTVALADGGKTKMSGQRFDKGGIPEGAEVEREDDYALWHMGVDGERGGKWRETTTYGGSLFENVTQAICRDLLVSGIRACEASGYPVVLHVHDEIVSETPKGFGDLKAFEKLAATAPAWAEGLPVVAKGWCGDRYRKE